MNISRRQQNKKQKSGYMLVEIMVALSIFTVVAVSSTGALLAIIDANAKAQTIKSVMDNLGVAVENISRTIRIGTDYKCFTSTNDLIANETIAGSNTDSACKDGASGIIFTPQNAGAVGDNVRYYYFTTASGGSIERYSKLTNSTTGVVTEDVTDITAPEVDIKSVKFHIQGANTSDGQPRVFIIINGQAGKTTQTKTLFNIQTTVTQRETDCDLSGINPETNQPYCPK